MQSIKRGQGSNRRDGGKTMNDKSSSAITSSRCPTHSTPPTQAINHLIRALEYSPPAPGNTRSYATKTGTKGREHTSYGKHKRDTSDNDRGRSRKKVMTKSNAQKETTTEKSKTIDDCMNIIDQALEEQRIDKKKAERLYGCLQIGGDWSGVAFSLLCEQIPMKRKGKGYSCRVCQVPKKGHTCVYCHICSTHESKYKKADDHAHVNCPICYEIGKKNKKLVQIKLEGHKCAYEAKMTA